MVTKFYIIDGDCSSESPVFVNIPLRDVLDSVESNTSWLFVKPVGQPGSAITSRTSFIEYMRTLSSQEESVEVVAYLHKSGSRLAELDELLS